VKLTDLSCILDIEDIFQYEHAEFGFEANYADFIGDHNGVLLSEKYFSWLVEDSNVVEDIEMAGNIPCRSRIHTLLIL